MNSAPDVCIGSKAEVHFNSLVLAVIWPSVRLRHCEVKEPSRLVLDDMAVCYNRGADAIVSGREVEEETGLTGIELGEKITTTYHTYTEFGKHILKESHWYKMKCNTDQKLVPQTEEHITDIKWVKQADLKKYTSKTFQTIVEVLSHLEK